MHRLQFEVRDEDINPLRQLAFKDHRTVRDQGSWLLHLKIQEEFGKLPKDDTLDELVEGVA